MKKNTIISLIIISLFSLLYSVKKGLDFFAVRNSEAGIVFFLAAGTCGLAAIILASQLYQKKKQGNTKKED